MILWGLSAGRAEKDNDAYGPLQCQEPKSRGLGSDKDKGLVNVVHVSVQEKYARLQLYGVSLGDIRIDAGKTLKSLPVARKAKLQKIADGVHYGRGGEVGDYASGAYKALVESIPRAG